MDELISAATARNWKKLNTDADGRLTARANKRRSRRRFIPAEYCAGPEMLEAVETLVNLMDRHGWETPQVLYTVGAMLLRRKGIFYKPHVQKVLYGCGLTEIPLAGWQPPTGEGDLLGLIYQSALYEGEKNMLGSYYTPGELAGQMVGDFDFSRGQTFLDPCCGSGAFLLAVRGAGPGQLTGYDSDPAAVMAARINLLLKFPGEVFIPDIQCVDYLGEGGAWRERQFDYIATNPPWGAASGTVPAAPEITSGETFSRFYVNAYRQLKTGGQICFLFPEAVLQVKCHRDIRTFLLEQGRMEQIRVHRRAFTGVTTGYVDILCRKNGGDSFQPCPVTVVQGEERLVMDSAVFYQAENREFRLHRREDLELLAYIQARGRYDLSDSIWAMGIVTGDNKKKLRTAPEDGWEPVYTGKEVLPYRMKPARYYLRYDRGCLQQAAREEYYRAGEKLVYRFISRRLVFAYDDTGSLLLNSANLVIPRIPHMSVRTVLAFLNSELYQYLYRQLAGGVKVLKGNLLRLPFPEITEEQNRRIEALAKERIQGGSEDGRLEREIYDSFGLSEAQIAVVRRTLPLDNLP